MAWSILGLECSGSSPFYSYILGFFFFFLNIVLVNFMCMCGHFFIPGFLARWRSQLKSQITREAYHFYSRS